MSFPAPEDQMGAGPGAFSHALSVMASERVSQLRSGRGHRARPAGPARGASGDPSTVFMAHIVDLVDRYAIAQLSRGRSEAAKRGARNRGVRS